METLLLPSIQRLSTSNPPTSYLNNAMMMSRSLSFSEASDEMIADSPWDILSSISSTNTSSGDNGGIYFTNANSSFSSNEELFLSNNGSYDLRTTDSPESNSTAAAGIDLDWGSVALVSLFCSIIAGTVVSLAFPFGIGTKLVNCPKLTPTNSQDQPHVFMVLRNRCLEELRWIEKVLGMY
jgi:hypothetical protein